MINLKRGKWWNKDKLFIEINVQAVRNYSDKFPVVNNLLEMIRRKLVFVRSELECEELEAMKQDKASTWEGKKAGVVHPYVAEGNWQERNAKRRRDEAK